MFLCLWSRFWIWAILLSRANLKTNAKFAAISKATIKKQTAARSWANNHIRRNYYGPSQICNKNRNAAMTTKRNANKEICCAKICFKKQLNLLWRLRLCALRFVDLAVEDAGFYLFHLIQESRVCCNLKRAILSQRRPGEKRKADKQKVSKLC